MCFDNKVNFKLITQTNYNKTVNLDTKFVSFPLFFTLAAVLGAKCMQIHFFRCVLASL